jgi:hypothetical protein
MTKLLFAALFALALTAGISAQSLKPSDLKPLEGTKWIGTLTYLDYSSGKPTSIQSDVIVTAKGKRSWAFAFEYPREPKANNVEDYSLSNDGKTFGGETIISTSKKNGILTFITTKAGKDSDRPATIRHTFMIGKSRFSIKKEVKIDGEDDYFERNSYLWTR